MNKLLELIEKNPVLGSFIDESTPQHIIDEMYQIMIEYNESRLRERVSDLFLKMVFDEKFKDKSWYLEVLYNLNLIIDSSFGSAAAVGFAVKVDSNKILRKNNTKLSLIINPYLFFILSYEQQVAVLLHEAHHIVRCHLNEPLNNSHVERMNKKIEELNIDVKNIDTRKICRYIHNISTDILINGYKDKPFIKYLPGSKGNEHPLLNAIFIDNVVEYLSNLFKIDKSKFEILNNIDDQKTTSDQITNFLIDIIVENLENIDQLNDLQKSSMSDSHQQSDESSDCESDSNTTKNEVSDSDSDDSRSCGDKKTQKTNIDSHDYSENPDNEELYHETVKSVGELVENVVRNSSSQQRGSLPSDFKELIELYEKLLRKEVIVSEALKKIIGTAFASNKEVSTRAVPNLIFPRDPNYLGSKQQHVGNLTIVVDTSGSMTTSDITNGIQYIKRISKTMKINIAVTYVDTMPSPFTPVSRKIKQVEISGGGGTFMSTGILYSLIGIRHNLESFRRKVSDDPIYVKAAKRMRLFEEYPKVIVIITDGYIEKEWDQDILIPDDTLIIVMSTSPLDEISLGVTSQKNTVALHFEESIVKDVRASNNVSNKVRSAVNLIKNKIGE